MPRINPYYLFDAMAPWAGLADASDEELRRYAEVDPNDEVKIKTLILDEIKPYLDTMNSAGRQAIRDTYRYYLTYDGVNFERMWDAHLPPFDAPKNAKNLFRWVWEVCFGPEEFHVDKDEQFEISTDISEPHRTIRTPKHRRRVE